MRYRPASERNGYVRVSTFTGTWFQLPLNEFEQLATAHKAFRMKERTDPIYEGRDLFGELLLLDLEDITHIWPASPATLEKMDAEAVARAEHERMYGDDE